MLELWDIQTGLFNTSYTHPNISADETVSTGRRDANLSKGISILR